MQREVWISHEGTFTIWQEDGVGGYISPAVRDEQYMQNVTLKKNLNVTKVGQPGASVKDVLTEPDGYTVSFRAFYEKKGEQWTPFDDRTKKWRLDLSMVNDRYSTVAPEENDDHVFRDASVSSMSVVLDDDQLLIVDVTFEAERME